MRSVFFKKNANAAELLFREVCRRKYSDKIKENLPKNYTPEEFDVAFDNFIEEKKRDGTFNQVIKEYEKQWQELRKQRKI